MKGDVLLQNIKVIGFIPIIAGRTAKESKLQIREAILTKLGKNIENVRKRCADKPLSLNIIFHLHKKSSDKKDLNDLSNSVIRILGKDVSTKKDGTKGLEIITNVNLLHRVIFDKNIIEKENKEGFSFSIYEWK